MYEHHSEPLLPIARFWVRMLRGLLFAILGIACGDFIGMLGYRHFEDMSWLNAFLNASMILGGMGPVNELHTDGGKLFAGFYALFSGLAFMAIFGLLITPVIHRVIHAFHSTRSKETPGNKS